MSMVSRWVALIVLLLAMPRAAAGGEAQPQSSAAAEVLEVFVRAVMQADTLMPSLAAVAALAVVVNFIELLCTAGLPAMYTAILTQHDLAPSAHYAYLGLYILAYMADDALMVATAVVALSSRKLTKHAGSRRHRRHFPGATLVQLASGL
jgi:hypothetical protein